MHYIKSFILLFGVIYIGKFLLPSVIILLLCYILIFITLKKQNPLNPLYWLFFSWAFLFSNGFSGIIEYKIIGDQLNKTILLFITSIAVFFMGFSLKSIKTPSSINVKIPLRSFFQNNINITDLEKIGVVFSYLSLIAFIFFIIEVVVTIGFDITNPNLLRQAWNSKEGASIFGQISSILYAGGYFAIVFFILFNFKKPIFLIGIFSFALASVFSAGRQQIFQVIILVFLCITLRNYLNIPYKIPRKFKMVFLSSLVLMFGYFIFLSSNRNKDESDTRTMMEIFATVNSFEYSDDFILLTRNLPPGLNAVTADISFYFSHETHAFAEQLNYENIHLFNFNPLPILAFVERQVDKLILRSETQQERMRKNAEKGLIGYLGSTSWKTANISAFRAFGFIGAYILIFLHGMLSYRIFSKTILNPNFVNINLSIANCLFLFYTILFPLITETVFLFYLIFIGILFMTKNKKSIA